MQVLKLICRCHWNYQYVCLCVFAYLLTMIGIVSCVSASSGLNVMAQDSVLPGIFTNLINNFVRTGSSLNTDPSPARTVETIRDQDAEQKEFERSYGCDGPMQFWWGCRF